MTRPRVAFLSNYPVPYQLEFLRALEAHGGLALRPLFVRGRDPGRAWPTSIEAHVLEGARLGRRDELFVPTKLWSLLDVELAVIGGYSFAAFQLALAVCALRRVPVLLWSELPRDDGPLLVRLARSLLLQPVRSVRGILAIGSRARAAWRMRLGDRIPVLDFPYVCDVDRYLALPRPQRAIDAPFTLLYCGQLVHRKGVDVLAEAFSRALPLAPQLRLTIAGEGPLLEDFTARLSPEARAKTSLRGHVPWEALPALYAGADALVLPSRHDGWGLVVNEALAAGLPVIATRAVGAAVDLVHSPETGLLVKPGDVAALSSALVEIAQRHLAARATSSRAARRIAEDRLLPAQAAARLTRIVTAVLAGAPFAEF